MVDISLYCDESNHLMHNSRFMTLGYTSCHTSKVKESNRAIRIIKEKHGLSDSCEIKWTKVSQGKFELYQELIDYFFRNESIEFRCVIADKEELDYKRYQLTHDDWYYRIYYLLLGKSLIEQNKYNIYIDIKDTCSGRKVNKLKEVLNNSYYDFSHTMINKIQHVHSHEVALLQLTDLIIGAIGYYNNGFQTSQAKLAVVKLLQMYSKNDLHTTTPLNDRKFNVFLWEAR